MNRINFIKETLELLHSYSISYCILRNFDFLIEEREPEKSSELGLDMVVSEKDSTEFDKLLRERGFVTAKRSFSRKHINYVAMCNLDLISFDVQIGGVHWNDMLYLDEEHILSNKVWKHFFYVPSDNDAFVMLVLHSIFGKRMFKSEYKKIISSISPDKHYVKARFKEIFDERTAQRLLDLALNSKYDLILQKKYFLVFSFIFRSPGRIAAFTLLFFRWLVWKWKKKGSAYPLVSIIGPDGAGKSTMTESLAAYLENNYRKVSIIYSGRGRDHILPITRLGYLYKVKELKKERDSEAREKRMKKESEKGSGNFSFLYAVASPVFALDQLLRYIFRIFPKRRTGHIVVTDRYCSDIMLMKHVPFQIKRFFLFFFPTPTISIYLYNTPEILHQRRPEEPELELKRQMEIFDQFTYSLRLKTSDLGEDQQKVISFVMLNLLKKGF